MRIGILGGGQLSRMLALSGIPLGIDFYFYEQKLSYGIENLGKIFYGDYSDRENLRKFIEKVDVITYENENISLDTIEYLLNHKPVHPNFLALKIGQDRLLEKELFVGLDIPTTKFFSVSSANELKEAVEKLGGPVFWKTRKFGYDGKGQIRICNDIDLSHALQQNLDVPAIVENQIVFDREISMIGVRDVSGKILFYDVSENMHKNGILRRTYNRINDKYSEISKDYLRRIMEKLDYIGVLAVEFFQVGEKLLANEMAPRVHNSGHWTIEGAVCSQFENHLRAVVGWPLGETRSVTQCAMYNIIGKFPDKKELLGHPNLHLHDYQKTPVVGRKIGHINIVNCSGGILEPEISRLLDI